jgi:hypothetical protein
MTHTTEDQMIEDQFDADWYLLQDEEEYIDTAVYDWHADIPPVIKEAAQAICVEYEGLLLTSIAHVENTAIYIAWYEDPTLDPEDDGAVLFREFTFVDGKAVDTYK